MINIKVENKNKISRLFSCSEQVQVDSSVVSSSFENIQLCKLLILRLPIKIDRKSFAPIYCRNG
jgi:hypothetical protein